MMKNQEKQYEVSTHLVAPLSLTQKSNFHILADVKGEFFIGSPQYCLERFIHVLWCFGLKRLFKEYNETLGFAQSFLWKRVFEP